VHSDADEIKLLISRDFKEGTVGWRRPPDKTGG